MPDFPCSARRAVTAGCAAAGLVGLVAAPVVGALSATSQLAQSVEGTRSGNTESSAAADMTWDARVASAPCSLAGTTRLLMHASGGMSIERMRLPRVVEPGEALRLADDSFVARLSVNVLEGLTPSTHPPALPPPHPPAPPHPHPPPPQARTLPPTRITHLATSALGSGAPPALSRARSHSRATRPAPLAVLSRSLPSRALRCHC
jgi:hypothetical protein